MKLAVSFFILLLSMPGLSHAQSLQNSEVIIDLNPRTEKTVSSKGSSNIYQNITNDNKLNPNLFQGEGYSIQIPYYEDFQRTPIGLTVSSLHIDFGDIKSGEPILRNHMAEVFSRGKRPYSLFISQNTALTSDSQNQIPNTTCDSGSCTSVLSDKWDSPLTYGFGYTCENRKTCVKAFHDGNFRRLGSLKNNESPTEIINADGNTKTSIIFKVNVSPAQQEESYRNTIYYILAPLF